MTEIQRWTSHIDRTGPVMIEDKSGKWIKWEDHLKALAERDELHQTEADNLNAQLLEATRGIL